MDVKAVEFTAEVRQVKTTVDHGVTLVLHLGEDCKEQAKQFISWQGELVRVVAVLDDGTTNEQPKLTKHARF